MNIISGQSYRRFFGPSFKNELQELRRQPQFSYDSDTLY